MRYIVACLMACGLINRASAGCNAANATNGELEVKVNGNTISENDLVYITKEPKMPTISAQLTGSPSGDLLWSASYEFTKSKHKETKTTTLDATNPCDILELLGGGFFGGEITIQLEDDNEKTCSSTFHIRGTNPDDNVVENYIGQSPWYAIPIAKDESRQAEKKGGGQWEYYCQFNRVDRWSPSAASETGACPNFGSPNGWGIMQLDPPPNNKALWNWKSNVDGGKSKINQANSTTDFWMNAPLGHPNKREGRQRVQSLTDLGYTLPVPDETVGGVTFKDGTSKPIEDAVAIKIYNSASTHYCYWSNNSKAWVFNRVNAKGFNYVKRVCSHAK